MTSDSNLQKLLAVLSFLALAASALAAEPPAEKPKAQTPAKPRVLVTISKETTYIIEPLRPDGYPDYLGALNLRFSQNVTPENNSAVLFWKAMGPANIPKDCRQRYFKMLGIPSLPDGGDYFVESDKFLERWRVENKKTEYQPNSEGRDPLWDKFQMIMKRPWSKQEFPAWAEWLARNEKPLALLVEASKRPRRYDPLLCSKGDMVIASLLPGPQASREAARALIVRAMLRLGEGRPADAWADLLACHRLARLVGQGTTLVEALVAITIDRMANAGDQALLECGKLTSAQIAAMRADLAKLPPLPRMADLLDTGDRFLFLDCVATMAREGISSLSEQTGTASQKGRLESQVESAGLAAIDWDLILRMGNSWHDRIVDAAHNPTRAERLKADAEIGQDLKKLRESATAADVGSLGAVLLGNTRKVVSERIGQILVSLMMPSLSACVEAEDRSATAMELNDLAFALAAYRADNGSYPGRLPDLVPKYVAEIPKDIFNNDADLHYTRQGDGYLLYSVGKNGKDDGGKGYEDAKLGENWDDIVVRVPATP